MFAQLFDVLCAHRLALAVFLSLKVQALRIRGAPGLPFSAHPLAWSVLYR